MRTRLAAQRTQMVCPSQRYYSTIHRNELQIYPSFSAGLIAVARHEGVRGMYAGIAPTLLGIVPSAALQFGFYEGFKRAFAVSDLPHCRFASNIPNRL